MRNQIEEAPLELCDYCNTEMTLTSSLKRNIQTPGVGYVVKYEREYKCECGRVKKTRANGESWRPNFGNKNNIRENC